LRYHDFDGEDFGIMESVRAIKSFGGASHITELSAYPVEFHADPNGVKSELIKRGRRFEGYAVRIFHSASMILRHAN